MSKPKRRNLIYCPESKQFKLQFDSPESAQNFIKYNADEIMEESGRYPIREYFCKSCGCYHVTSHEKHPSKEERLVPKIGYSIDPWLTEMYQRLKEAVDILESKALTKDALYSIQDAIPLFWELRMTKYKTKEKRLQSELKALTIEFGKEVKNLKNKEIEDDRLLYYKNKLAEIKEEGGSVLESQERKDTSHLSNILGRKEQLGEEYQLCIDIIYKMRKISSMTTTGAREANIEQNWNELEQMMDQVTDQTARVQLEYMKDLLY